MQQLDLKVGSVVLNFCLTFLLCQTFLGVIYGYEIELFNLLLLILLGPLIYNYLRESKKVLSIKYFVLPPILGLCLWIVSYL
jgi:TctA family transporter